MKQKRAAATVIKSSHAFEQHSPLTVIGSRLSFVLVTLSARKWIYRRLNGWIVPTIKIKPLNLFYGTRPVAKIRPIFKSTTKFRPRKEFDSFADKF